MLYSVYIKGTDSVAPSNGSNVEGSKAENVQTPSMRVKEAVSASYLFSLNKILSKGYYASLPLINTNFAPDSINGINKILYSVLYSYFTIHYNKYYWLF